MYRSIASFISKPLSFLLARTQTAHIETTKPKSKRRNRKTIALTPMDEMIFKSTKPNYRFLNSTYGFHVQVIRNIQQSVQRLSMSWTAQSTTYNNQDNSNNNHRVADQFILLPFVVLSGYALTKNEETHCFFGRSTVKKNDIEQRAVLLQYAANNPIEDRYKVSQLKNISGYVVSVFDGHGGWQLAELAMNTLHEKIDQYLRENQGLYQEQDDYIQKSIAQAYASVEEEFYKIAIQAYEVGFPMVARVGACALTAVVIDNKVYSANLGDCKGIIVNVADKSDNAFTKINHMLNANSKKEQIRLKASFNDDDIVICKSGKGSCYVKGRLQPTRSLGDFRLKFPEFNNPKNLSGEQGYVRRIDNFNGPYINAVPEQQIFSLKKGDRYLVMGSDGLWDEMTKQDITRIVHQSADNKDTIIKQIFEQSLAHAAKESKLTDEEIRRIPLGKRRKVHDDITIIVLDLDKQL